MTIDYKAIIAAQPVRPAEPTEPECPQEGCENGFIEIPAAITGDVDRYARCPQCASRLKRQKQAKILEEAGVGGMIYASSWDGLDLSHESWQLARTVASTVSDLVTENLGLIFVGDYGRGKTQAATLILSAAAAAGHSVARVKWGQFVRRIRATYKGQDGMTEDQLIAAIVAPDLILLDDVGAADKHSEHNERLLTSVIDERYDAGRPMILTTNLGRPELEAHLGGRAFSRLWNNSEVVVFDGPNYRERQERPRARELAARLRERAREQFLQAAD